MAIKPKYIFCPLLCDGLWCWEASFIFFASAKRVINQLVGNWSSFFSQKIIVLSSMLFYPPIANFRRFVLFKLVLGNDSVHWTFVWNALPTQWCSICVRSKCTRRWWRLVCFLIHLLQTRANYCCSLSSLNAFCLIVQISLDCYLLLSRKIV